MASIVPTFFEKNALTFLNNTRKQEATFMRNFNMPFYGKQEI